MAEQSLRLFVSSPGDVDGERRRIDLVVDRLNAEFAGRVRIQTVRWELSYYSAHDTFQRQIPEAAECDVVVAVFRGRLGTPLPPAFPAGPSGEPYPSGSAYEVLSAIEVRRAGKRVPDVYVFRSPDAPLVGLDAPDRAEVEAQWDRLKGFFDRWFRTQSGEFLAAFQTYRSTDDFAAKVEDCLRQWLATRGFLPQGAVWDRVLHGSPFPGLAPFDADRGGVFFGRDGAVAQAVARLRGASLPFLLVLGASGSGKSSLLRAGLLPALARPGALPEVDLWRTAVMTPGADPFAALADALFAPAALGAELRAGTFRTREMLARQLAADPAVAVAPLRDALEQAAARRQAEAGFDAPRPARLLLGIDQAERLFTEAAPAAASALAALLAALVRQHLASVVVVLRSDAYPRLQGEPALVALREDGATLDLLPPGAAELEQIVTGPVASCQPPLAFEPGLATRLAADAKGGDALPLLQVTLARLYAAEAGRGDGVLRAADYAGMGAAVTETANAALAGVDADARAALPALVAGLVADVSVDGRTGAAVPVVGSLDRAAFASTPARGALLEAFVAHRLLTADDGRVRPVHEALLRIWPQAVAIVAEGAALIRVRHTLSPLVRDWADTAEADRAAHLELSPALLDGAQALLARFGADLPPDMRQFIAQAAAADAARRGRERAEAERRVRDAEALAAARRRTAHRTGAGLAAALVLAAVAGWQWREAGQQRDRARLSLDVATATANSLVFDLAQKFRDVAGVPAATVKDILDHARALQDQLLAAGETSAALRRSQAGALVESSDTLLLLNDTAAALRDARGADTILVALSATDPAAEPQYDVLVAHERVAAILRVQGDLPGALAGYRAALAIAERLVAAEPANPEYRSSLALSRTEVGDVQRAAGDIAAALASYQAALATVTDLAQADPGNERWQRKLGIAFEKIGDLQREQADLAGARRSHLAMLAIGERLAAANPGSTAAQRDLAVDLVKVGEIESLADKPAALRRYRAALAIFQRLATADPGNARMATDLSACLGKVAELEATSGDLPAALASATAAHAIAERLAAADGGNADGQRRLAVATSTLGGLQAAGGDSPAALRSFRAALAIAQTLAGADPANASRQAELAAAHDKVGDLQRGDGAREDALSSYRAALSLRQHLVTLNPANVQWAAGLATSLGQVGDMQRVMGDPVAALASDQAGLAVLDRLIAAQPDSTVLLVMLKGAHQSVGDLRRGQGDFAGALEHYGPALDIARRLAAAQPGDGKMQRALATALERVGVTQKALGHTLDARDAVQSAGALREALLRETPDDAELQRSLAVDCAQVATLDLRFGDRAAARQQLARGRDLLAALVRADPANVADAGQLALFQQGLAALDQ